MHIKIRNVSVDIRTTEGTSLVLNNYNKKLQELGGWLNGCYGKLNAD